MSRESDFLHIPYVTSNGESIELEELRELGRSLFKQKLLLGRGKMWCVSLEDLIVMNAYCSLKVVIAETKAFELTW